MKAVKMRNIGTCIWVVSTAAFTVVNGVWDFSGTTTQSMTSKYFRHGRRTRQRGVVAYCSVGGSP